MPRKDRTIQLIGTADSVPAIPTFTTAGTSMEDPSTTSPCPSTTNSTLAATQNSSIPSKSASAARRVVRNDAPSLSPQVSWAGVCVLIARKGNK